ncbi:ABC transporter ATP-binding protein [Pseudomaricurvus alkylphenolicus]|uniref:ABC transporter ATP-binding protein n=1 Tax=Pseudomaricurvus alkylphenolicus TaxID=1306991 RepID=UPI001422F52A|nr:ABC transporter ATP-binding protein [Pseudomaricurvus alkylphenolicus]NIB42362.1 ABC transporter ATP-binding protein [Pseudomaricurvus alkylphenolicus]
MNEQSSSLVKARGLCKRYGSKLALDNLDIDIQPGRIVGLIGPNGAGKTTALKCLLGLAPAQGELMVLGLNPRQARTALLEDVCFIADTAILPRWMKVSQSLDYLEGVHPKFDRSRAAAFLQTTSIRFNSRVKDLSKGMITQLHLALVMAIDAKLLILDEPTLGLDILYRKQFYTTLLNNYFDDDKTIIIATHQVEEIEHILTDLIFIKDGKIVLDTAMDTLSNTYLELKVRDTELDQARALNPIGERSLLGSRALIYENADRETLAKLGELHTPGITDLFVAKMKASPGKTGLALNVAEVSQ